VEELSKGPLMMAGSGLGMSKAGLNIYPQAMNLQILGYNVCGVE